MFADRRTFVLLAAALLVLAPIVGAVGVVAFILPGQLVGALTAIELLLVLFAVVGHLTALQRFWGAWSDLN